MPDSTPNGRVTLAVLATKLDYLIQKVDKIDKQTGQDRKRLEKMEGAVTILKWVGGTIGAITVALAIAWLKQALGL